MQTPQDQNIATAASSTSSTLALPSGLVDVTKT
jgi:hypothetical protein